MTWCQVAESSRLQIMLSSGFLRPLVSRDSWLESTSVPVNPRSQLHHPQSCTGNNLSLRAKALLEVHSLHPRTSRNLPIFSFKCQTPRAPLEAP